MGNGARQHVVARDRVLAFDIAVLEGWRASRAPAGLDVERCREIGARRRSGRARGATEPGSRPIASARCSGPQRNLDRRHEPAAANPSRDRHAVIRRCCGRTPPRHSLHRSPPRRVGATSPCAGSQKDWCCRQALASTPQRESARHVAERPGCRVHISREQMLGPNAAGFFPYTPPRACCSSPRTLAMLEEEDCRTVSRGTSGSGRGACRRDRLAARDRVRARGRAQPRPHHRADAGIPRADRFRRWSSTIQHVARRRDSASSMDARSGSVTCGTSTT